MQPRQKVILIFVLILCSFILSLPLIRSGLSYSYGFGYWGPNGHDGIWHLSLINHISNPINISHPTFYPQKLTNYHPLFDIIIAYASKISKIDSGFLYFQIFPLFSSFLLLYLCFVLAYSQKKSYLQGLLLIIFSTILGSLGWIVTLIRHRVFAGESLFWSMQSASVMFNPPLVLSLIFILIALIILTSPRAQISKYYWLVVILASITPITKSYGGVALFLLLIIFTFQKKFPLKKLFISLLLASILFFTYNLPSASGLFEFKPFWFINSMFSSTDRLYLPKVSSFISTTIQSKNFFDFRFLLIETIGLIIFLIGNFGWRIFAIFKPKLFLFHRHYFWTILILFLIPLFFVQKGTPWNTIQFIYFALFFSNIVFADFITNIRNIFIQRSLIFIIIITSILGNIDTYHGFLGNPAPANLPQSEITALNFLKNLPSLVVLTYPYNSYLKNSFNHTPIPLYAYETTAYVSALSTKYSYYDDEMNLIISGYDYQSRRDQVDKFFKALPKDSVENRGFLVQNDINYIYIANSNLQPFSPDLLALGIVKIYDSNLTVIYEVKR